MGNSARAKNGAGVLIPFLFLGIFESFSFRLIDGESEPDGGRCIVTLLWSLLFSLCPFLDKRRMREGVLFGFFLPGRGLDSA